MNCRNFLFALFAASMLMLSACTGDRVYMPEDPESGWYPSKVENTLAGTDPLEGYNRGVLAFNDFLMQWIVDPIGRVYGSIMPKPGFDCIENFCKNLEFPYKCISSLGCAEWRGAGDEFCRFLINTTIGIAGLFDPAENWLHIHSTESDCAIMFAEWGIGPGCTFMFPLIPRTNVRDFFGFLCDCVLDIRTYVPYSYLATLNRAVVRQQNYASTVSASPDHYKAFRMVMTLYRETVQRRWMYRKLHTLDEQQKQMLDPQGNLLPNPPLPVKFSKNTPKPAGLRGNWIAQPEFYPQTPLQETLRGVMTTPKAENEFWWNPHTLFNQRFYRKIDIRKLKREDDLDDARYAFFAQPEPKTDEEKANAAKNEKLVILLPGIDGTYDGKSTLAMAETYYEQGYNVISLDSVFFWRGAMEGAGAEHFPGYLPDDAARIRSFLTEIMADLRKDGLLHQPVRTVLTGWSYGALCAAHIAEAESKDNTLKLDRVLLINPPADLDFALNYLDGTLKKSARWSADELRKMIPGTVGEMMVSMGTFLPVIKQDDPEVQRKLRTAYAVPQVSEDVAAYLTSVSLRSGIRDILYTKHLKAPLPGIQNPNGMCSRNSLYDELDRIDFQQYVQRFLLPQLQKDPKKGKLADYQTLAKQTSLYGLQDFLSKSEKIRVLHNYNDILINDRDRQWLDNTFGKRITWFDAGGHLGNWYLQRFRDTVIDVSK